MIGAYGTVSIEMMAKGVPVVCRIRDDLRPYYPCGPPTILSAEPFSDARHSARNPGPEIYAVLENLIQTPRNLA